MKIAAVIGVKDEAELIGAAATHMRKIGVDLVLVFDVGSQDGSAEIVQDLSAKDPQIRLVEVSGSLFNAWPEYEAALDGFEPDWILPADADEFWLPRGGSLKRLPEFLGEDDVIVVERFNVPLRSPQIDVLAHLTQGQGCDLPLIVDRERLNPQIMRAEPQKRWIMNEIGRKLACRPEFVRGISIGGHAITPPRGEVLRKRSADSVIVAHVPFTSFERFERKIENIRHELDPERTVLTGNRGWHWRRWVDIADRGLLRAEFEAQRMDGADFEMRREAGAILTAAEVLRDRASA